MEHNVTIVRKSGRLDGAKGFNSNGENAEVSYASDGSYVHYKNGNRMAHGSPTLEAALGWMVATLAGL